MYYLFMNEIIWKNRWPADQIKSILIEQFDTFWSTEIGIQRECLDQIEQTANSPFAIIISGLRRVGKSTLLAQIAHRLGKEAFYYINFEDDRFIGFQAEDTNDLFEILLELFGERKIFLLDEIQNVPGWEHFVRRFTDNGYKFYITGSNASLLSQELGTRLTGRYIPIELFPLSFKEYLLFKNISIPDFSRMKTMDRVNLNLSLNDYLESGGIPLELKFPKLHFLETLYNDVIFRDIVSRYQIEAVSSLRELSLFLMSNPASLISFNKLKENHHIKSINSVKTYISYLENSWLIFTLNVYDYSIKRQQIAPKKVYCIDNGLAKTVGFHFSPNTGKLLENLVFLQLRRSSKQIFYLNLPSGEEVDFYLPQQRMLVQVSQQIDHEETRQREIRALSKAMDTFPVEKCLLLTDRNNDPFKIGNTPVEIRSTAEWLLEP
jgi:predicted AAA+ superfamily ATPase